MAVSACGDRAKAHAQNGGILDDYMAYQARVHSKDYLGGLNVWGYCESLGYSAVGYSRGYVQGPRAAYANWVCQTGTNQLAPVNPHPVDMAKACAWQFPQAGDSVVAKPSDPNHAWSWDCYRKS